MKITKPNYIKIKLTCAKFIAGEPCKKGDIVEVSDGVAEWLIERGAAEKLTKPNADK